jgi:hypothetical protein
MCRNPPAVWSAGAFALISAPKWKQTAYHQPT